MKLPTNGRPDFRLASQQQQNPQEVLNCFFNAYDITTIKQYISACVEVALITDNDRFVIAEDRADLVRFSHSLEELLEAVCILQEAK